MKKLLLLLVSAMSVVMTNNVYAAAQADPCSSFEPGYNHLWIAYYADNNVPVDLHIIPGSPEGAMPYAVVKTNRSYPFEATVNYTCTPTGENSVHISINNDADVNLQLDSDAQGTPGVLNIAPDSEVLGYQLVGPFKEQY